MPIGPSWDNPTDLKTGQSIGSWFTNLFNRAKPIQTQKGKVITVERTLASLTFPLKFTIEGALPQGEMDCYAMAAYGKDQVALAIPSTGNPFTDPVKWEVNFFQWLFSDRLIPYRTVTNTGTKYVVDGYATLIREHLTANKVTSLLFAVGPKGEIQKWNLDNAHIVRVNLR
jgi:hypothetical protein